MRIIANLGTNEILQAEATPPLSALSPINGKYVIEVPAGQIPLNSSSYITPVDGGDVYSLAMQNLLNSYPTLSNIVFNPLLTSADIASLDTAAIISNASGQVLPAPYDADMSVRAQLGRGAGSPTGNSPGSVALLPNNPYTSPERPGCLITDTIDISAYTGGLGASNFLLYWKIYKASVSHDIRSTYGVSAGTNDPAIKHLEEIDQEPPGFHVALSTDDGASYHLVERLKNTATCGAGDLLRLAFLNTSPDKIYLAAYAILF